MSRPAAALIAALGTPRRASLPAFFKKIPKTKKNRRKTIDTYSIA